MVPREESGQQQGGRRRLLAAQDPEFNLLRCPSRTETHGSQPTAAHLPQSRGMAAVLTIGGRAAVGRQTHSLRAVCAVGGPRMRSLLLCAPALTWKLPQLWVLCCARAQVTDLMRKSLHFGHRARKGGSWEPGGNGEKACPHFLLGPRRAAWWLHCRVWPKTSETMEWRTQTALVCDRHSGLWDGQAFQEWSLANQTSTGQNRHNPSPSLYPAQK